MVKPQKKPYRPKINNNNPNNKLQLNKFHQIQGRKHSSYSKVLHKKKRDLERLINFKKQKNQQVDEQKARELQEVNRKLSGNSKKFEKTMRKQFFIKNKYKQIMEVEMRKVKKKLNELYERSKNQDVKSELVEWQKKQRYIRFYPKTLKYVSLFPNSKPLEQKAIQFQQKIMNDIQEKNRKQVQRKNAYVSQNKIIEKKSNQTKNRKNKDNFFIMDEQQSEEQRDE